MFGPNSLYPAFSLILSPYQHVDLVYGSIPYKLAMTLILSYLSLCWTLSIAYFVSHCIIIVELFKDYNQCFIYIIKNKSFGPTNECINPNIHDELTEECLKIKKIYLNGSDLSETGSEEEFEYYRLWHLKLCQCVSSLDNCYNLFIAVTITLYTSIFLLIIYTMTDWNGNCIRGLMEFLYPFWALVAIFLMFLIIIFAAKINKQAHLYLVDLFNISNRNFTISFFSKVFI
jgi:hypothetical protein